MDKRTDRWPAIAATIESENCQYELLYINGMEWTIDDELAMRLHVVFVIAISWNRIARLCVCWNGNSILATMVAGIVCSMLHSNAVQSYWPFGVHNKQIFWNYMLTKHVSINPSLTQGAYTHWATCSLSKTDVFTIVEDSDMHFHSCYRKRQSKF